MKISDILEEKLVVTNLPGASKDDIINAMVDLLAKSSKVLDKEKVRASIFERERIMSTGVGNGFAIPHGKTDAVVDIVASFGITRDPMNPIGSRTKTLASTQLSFQNPRRKPGAISPLSRGR